MRYILTLLLISTMTVLAACQSTTATKSGEEVEKSEVVKPEVSATKKDTHNHSKSEAERISLEDAKKAFDAGDAIFIDTRSEDAFKNEHVKGAINISTSNFESKYKDVPKDKKLIIYCS